MALKGPFWMLLQSLLALLRGHFGTGLRTGTGWVNGRAYATSEV